jgi:hypothetical protein
VSISQTYAAAKQAEDIEKSFEQALQIGMREIDTDLQMTHKFVFDQLRGIMRVAVGAGLAHAGEWSSLAEVLSDGLFELFKRWRYMNYGGVYGIVSQFPHMEHLDKACRRLVNKELNLEIVGVVRQASEVLAGNYGLVRAGAS